MLYPKPKESRDSRFMFIGQVEMSLREDDQVLVMFASLRLESEVVMVDLPIMCEFPDVLPEDIIDLPP